jgi:hypothetical protein
MVELIRILDRIMKDHFSKAAARQEKRKDEDYDEVNILVMECVCQILVERKVVPQKYKMKISAARCNL